MYSKALGPAWSMWKDPGVEREVESPDGQGRVAGRCEKGLWLGALELELKLTGH